MTGDGHEMTFGGHDVTEEGQMAVVDVETVELEHRVHLLLDRFADGFDAQHGEDLADVVGIGAHGIHVAFAEDAHQRRSVRLQQPFSDGLVLTCVQSER